MEDDDGEEEELFFPQQITFCLPLASMAQKKPSWPNAAEIGPIDPNPDAVVENRSRRSGKRVKDWENPERVARISMVGVGFDGGFGSVVSWTGVNVKVLSVCVVVC